jgi:hypothetical protein
MKTLTLLCVLWLSVSAMACQTTGWEPQAQSVQNSPVNDPEAEIEVWVQQDIDTKLADLNAGNVATEDESAAYQKIVLEDGSQSFVFDDFALLICEDGTIIGLDMVPVEEEIPTMESGSDVSADCEFVPPNTMFCTYIWGNKIRIIIFRVNEDGTWQMVFDSGWFEKQQNPTPKGGSIFNGVEEPL